MNIAILGTGKVGSALGARLASSGHQVLYGSRNPSAASGRLDRRAAVASSADVVVTAIPGTAVLTTLDEIGEDALGDKLALDPSVAPTEHRTMASYGDSVARQVQERFPRARVVKALNTMNHTIMVDPRASLPQATVFVSGDDPAALRTPTFNLSVSRSSK